MLCIHIPQSHRLAIGVLFLLLVDAIWVTSSEMTVYIFKDLHYDKPFFTTYLKTVMLAFNLLGYLFLRTWLQQCWKQGDRFFLTCKQGDTVYVPLKYEKGSSGTESDDAAGHHAEEAAMSRLSYEAYVMAKEERQQSDGRLTIRQVVKLAFVFSFLWFFANYMYQEALSHTSAGIINVLSCTSGLFTLVSAALFPSSSSDRFTLSKLVAVLLSLGGVGLVSLSDASVDDTVPAGALLALCSAVLYSVYLVMLRRRVSHEDRFDIPMFLGFVGLICAICMWPGLVLLHQSQHEPFDWPTSYQLFLVVINGFTGTVLSEVLWLWACFLTSSLMGTLAISLTIPMTMFADVVFRRADYSFVYYVGTVPIFVSFFGVAFLTHWENWDPVLFALKKGLHYACRCRNAYSSKTRELDREQTANLINDDDA